MAKTKQTARDQRRTKPSSRAAEVAPYFVPARERPAGGSTAAPARQQQRPQAEEECAACGAALARAAASLAAARAANEETARALAMAGDLCGAALASFAPFAPQRPPEEEEAPGPDPAAARAAATLAGLGGAPALPRAAGEAAGEAAAARGRIAREVGAFMARAGQVAGVAAVAAPLQRFAETAAAALAVMGRFTGPGGDVPPADDAALARWGDVASPPVPVPDMRVLLGHVARMKAANPAADKGAVLAAEKRKLVGIFRPRFAKGPGALAPEAAGAVEELFARLLGRVL